VLKSPFLKEVQTISWGNHGESDLQIRSVHKEGNMTTLKGTYAGADHSIRIPFTDDASVENALHCWCTMLALGYAQDFIAAGMEALTPVAMRLELKEGINRCSLINDYYNSDLNSLSIALDFLEQQKQHPKKTVILSDILQSGRKQEDLYHEISGILQKKNISRLIGIGKEISRQSDAFTMDKAFFESTDDFLRHFPFSSFRDESILLKGARLFEFERISRQLQQKVHETILEINLDAIIHNLNYFRAKLNPGTRTMAMVKAFSYGSGSYEIASLLQFHRVDYLAVAYADEGVELRRAGITLPVMVMNPEAESFDLILKYGLEPEIYNFRVLEMLEDAMNGNTEADLPDVKIHIKLDTGMHRLGFEEKDIDLLIRRLNANSRIRIQSVFSHLAASEDPAEDEFTRSQTGLLNVLSERIRIGTGSSFFGHILNSAGVTRFPEAQLGLVRLGIGLYGVGFDATEQEKLRNVSTLKTTISQIKHIKAGDTIGYNRKGIAVSNLVIAVIPVGYADGINRRLGNGTGKVFIHGKPAPFIGNISMDTCMADITEIANQQDDQPVIEGDEVIVFSDRYPVSLMAKDLGTIPYEILTGISRRVKRIYFHE
jgi:alanine racemase